MLQCNVTLKEVPEGQSNIGWVVGWGLLPFGNPGLYKIVCWDNAHPN
jgi:hypothetical protein